MQGYYTVYKRELPPALVKEQYDETVLESYTDYEDELIGVFWKGLE
jgi:hypothetical protein